MSAPAPTAESRDDWDRHWSAYAASNSVNPAQAYRRQLIFSNLALDGAPRPVRLLEIGSGQGELSREVLDRFPDVDLVGIDLSQTGVDIAARRVPKGRFFQQDLMLPVRLPDQLRGWATHAVCSEVLEHVEDPVRALQNIRVTMAPGCRLVITVPSGPMSAFDHHIGHLRHFTAESLGETLRAAGYEVSGLWGAGFPFFNLYRLVVIARGKALIKDAGGGEGKPLPPLARLVTAAFSRLFRLNRATTSRGWQLVAVASPRG